MGALCHFATDDTLIYCGGGNFTRCGAIEALAPSISRTRVMPIEEAHPTILLGWNKKGSSKTLTLQNVDDKGNEAITNKKWAYREVLDTIHNFAVRQNRNNKWTHMGLWGTSLEISYRFQLSLKLLLRILTIFYYISLNSS